MTYSKSLFAIVLLSLCASASAAVIPGPSYTATLSGTSTPTLTLKAKNFALFSLLGLPLTSGQNLRGSIEIGVTLVSNGTLVILTSNLNQYSYSSSVNPVTSVASANGKSIGDSALIALFTFTGKSTNLTSQLSLKTDISAIAPSLPQTAGKKSKPTLVGTTQFTFVIGSAAFVGTVSSKGKVTYATP